MNLELLEQQRDEARLNSSKKVSELKVGDFVNLIESGMKNDSGKLLNAVGDMTYKDIPLSETFCRIEKIVTCTSNELDNQKFNFGAGGSQSDAIEDKDNFNEYRPTREQSKSFYQKVTLVMCDDGRYLFVDSQGFNYPRYVMFWHDWSSMYSKEISTFKKILNDREESAIKEKQLIIENMKKKAYDDFSFLDFSKSTLGNFKRILEKKFPNGVFSVSLKKRKIISNYEPDEVLSYLKGLDNDYRYETFECNDSGYGSVYFSRNALEELIGPCKFSLFTVY